MRKNQFTLDLREPAKTSTVVRDHPETHPETHPAPSNATAKVYSYEAVKADRARREDAAHFRRILQLVRHFR
jgi:hypothetical protein